MLDVVVGGRLGVNFFPPTATSDFAGPPRTQWRIQKILVGGMIKILSTKPQKFGCVVTRRVARNSQWSGCFRGLGARPPALKNFAFFCKNNLIL